MASCALGFALSVVYVVSSLTATADFGLAATPTLVPLVDRLSVRPDSPAYSSGLRDGDVLDTRQLSPQARYRLYSGAYAREPVQLKVIRNGVPRAVTLEAPNAAGLGWTFWLFAASFFWIVSFCTLLAWLRPDSPEARSLVFYLLAVFVVSQGFGFITTPWPALDFTGLLLKTLLFAPGYAFLALYAACFGRPVSRTRTILTGVAFALAAVFVVTGFVQYFGVWNGAVDPFTEQLLVRSSTVARIVLTLEILVVMWSLLAAFAASRAAERTRLLWSLGAVLPFLLWSLVITAAGERLPFAIFFVGASLFWFATPAILSYTLLNRRLCDVGFVVNRAAVFTGVSVVLLGAFVLVEWLLADWLRDASHATNVLVSGGVALALGLSIRFVHGRVDRLVDNVFFRKRHEDEEAIRTFGREAPYVTDPELLLRRTIETLARHTNAAFVDVVLEYDENDPAILRLRARPQVLDLHGLDTQLHGDIAFPMTARGKLLGVIVLGPRRSSEIYAPDETAAIQQLADSVAAALDILSTRNGHTDVLEQLVTSIEGLRAEIVRRLPSEAPTA